MNVPFKIYDFICVLFPGILTLGFIYLETPFNSYPLEEDVIHLAFYFVVAYITGMILQHFSRVLFKTINLLIIWERLTKRLRNLFRKQNREYQNRNEDKKIIKGRHGNYCFSEKLQAKIQKAFYDLYALDLNEVDREEAFALIYLQNDMKQREAFVATGNMKRALAVLAEFIAVFYFVKFFFFDDITCFINIAIFLGIHLLLANGVYYFNEMSDKLPYLIFYKKYCEHNYKKEPTINK